MPKYDIYETTIAALQDQVRKLEAQNVALSLESKMRKLAEKSSAEAQARLLSLRKENQRILQEALATLDWYADGNHRVVLSGPLDWVAERARLLAAGFDREGEAYNGDESFTESGRKAWETANKLRTLQESQYRWCFNET